MSIKMLPNAIMSRPIPCGLPCQPKQFALERSEKNLRSAKFVIAHGILFYFIFSSGKISFSAEEKGEEFFPAEDFHVKVFKTARKI